MNCFKYGEKINTPDLFQHTRNRKRGRQPDEERSKGNRVLRDITKKEDKPIEEWEIFEGVQKKRKTKKKRTKRKKKPIKREAHIDIL